LLLLFPIFWGIGALANPGLSRSAEAAPVIVAGPDCSYDPFAEQQATPCGRLLQDLTALGVSYDVRDASTNGGLTLSIGNAGVPIGGELGEDNAARAALVRSELEANGYDFSEQYPPLPNILGIVGLLLVLGMLSALTYGSVAALLSEMFPPKIRYSSMSIPYHIGAGYLGGFLPLIAGYIVATTGNPFSGLWYTWVVVAFGVLVAWWGLPSGPTRDFADDI
jgi:hypothetical protein